MDCIINEITYNPNGKDYISGIINGKKFTGSYDGYSLDVSSYDNKGISNTEKQHILWIIKR